MSKKNNITINIAKLIAPIVSSRDVTKKLKAVIKEAKTDLVYLDLRNIQFVSRSAAHELLSIKDDFKNRRLNKKEVLFINANDNVKEMLRVVAASRAVPAEERPEFNPDKVSIESLCN